MLSDLRDYIKTNWLSDGQPLAEHYSIGKINNAQEKSIGIYSQNGFVRVEAIGKESSYDIAGVQILVHWNKNAKETEQIARSLYGFLRYITETTMGEQYIAMVEMNEGEPVFIGSDDNGVYEYHIGLLLYYQR